MSGLESNFSLYSEMSINLDLLVPKLLEGHEGGLFIFTNTLKDVEHFLHILQVIDLYQYIQVKYVDLAFCKV